MRCKICGSDNSSGSKYCTSCGALIENNIYSEKNEELGIVNYQKEQHGTAAMILGLISLILGLMCCLGWISIIASIATGIGAIVFSSMSLKSKSKGQAIAGMVLGILGLIIGLLMLFFTLTADIWLQWFEENYPELWEEYYNSL